MKITFACIVLNEADFIGKWLRQHYEMADQIVIVEGADRRYPLADPDGLSMDNTRDAIGGFLDVDRKITYVRHGWANSKAELRDQYAQGIDDGILICPDADEFLSKRSFERLVDELKSLKGPGCVRIPIVHAWKDLDHIVRGGYYSVPHNRAYRWSKGLRYKGDEHNHPQFENGKLLYQVELKRIDPEFGCTTAMNFDLRPGHNTNSAFIGEPFFWHMGFARSPESIAAKNAYYVARGEATTRPETTRDRAAWFGSELPKGVEVWGWRGPWPEVFQKESCSRRSLFDVVQFGRV